NTNTMISQNFASSYQLVEGNHFACNPAATGFSSSNVGIGNVPSPGNGAQFWPIIENCNPSSATYGDSINATPRNSTTLPSTGTWIASQFVQARNATATVNGYVLGWARLNTGTGNVPGTDWAEIVGYFGDGA